VLQTLTTSFCVIRISHQRLMLYMSKCRKILEWRSKIGVQNVNLNWFKLVFLGIINIDIEAHIFLHSCEFRV
jgi:hypothetical protein